MSLIILLKVHFEWTFKATRGYEHGTASRIFNRPKLQNQVRHDL